MFIEAHICVRYKLKIKEKIENLFIANSNIRKIIYHNIPCIRDHNQHKQLELWLSLRLLGLTQK